MSDASADSPHGVADAPTRWYVRFRGRVSGPFAEDRLRAMCADGRVGRLHEVSNDRVVWQSASTALRRAETAAPVRESSAPVREPVGESVGDLREMVAPTAGPCDVAASFVSWPCAVCAERLTIESSEVGQEAECPTCGAVSTVPAQTVATAPEPSPTPEPDPDESVTGVELAGLGRRSVASLLDLVVVAVPLASIVIAASMISATDERRLASEVEMEWMVIGMGLGLGLIALALEMVYRALMEASSFQGTLGKIAFGLRVTDQHGRRLTGARASLRQLGQVLSRLIFPIGHLVALFTARRQALHDLIAGTLVVRPIKSDARALDIPSRENPHA